MERFEIMGKLYSSKALLKWLMGWNGKFEIMENFIQSIVEIENPRHHDFKHCSIVEMHPPHPPLDPPLIWGWNPQPPKTKEVWGRSRQRIFRVFWQKTLILAHFFMEKGHVVSAIAIIMDYAKIFLQLMCKSRSLARISKRRLQPLLIWEIIDWKLGFNILLQCQRTCVRLCFISFVLGSFLFDKWS